MNADEVLPGAGGQPALVQTTCYWCGKPVQPNENGICAECDADEARADEMRAVWREWDRDGR